ncbi:hypothetical protein [Bacillus sp. FJAT-29937]|uniref:hypothetical protein n=1 Tax=Bacillus sp. FJAT-29937 TaxID=1720553 RepID=UPI0012E364E1|nr:hypothetical protein [Bacillus sp. FJAT-29937]
MMDQDSGRQRPIRVNDVNILANRVNVREARRSDRRRTDRRRSDRRSDCRRRRSDFFCGCRRRCGCGFFF